jgi:hypothetical protein
VVLCITLGRGILGTLDVRLRVFVIKIIILDQNQPTIYLLMS